MSCDEMRLRELELQDEHSDDNDDNDSAVKYDATHQFQTSGNESQEEQQHQLDQQDQQQFVEEITSQAESVDEEQQPPHLKLNVDEFIEREALESPPPSQSGAISIIGAAAVEEDYDDGTTTNGNNIKSGTITHQSLLPSLSSCSCSFSSTYQRHRWVVPFLGAAFVCFCLISSVNRPYEVILERRQRSFHSRKIFVSFPKFPSSLSHWRNNNSNGGSNGDGNSDRLLGYYNGNGNGNGNYGYNNYNNYNNNNGNNGNYYGNGGNNNNDDDNDDAKSDDDGYNAADDDDDAGDDVGDDVVDDASNETYYEEVYYEPEEDDFFRYIDDSIEAQTVFPLEFTDYAGFICAALSIILSVGGGIGPGAILVAVFIIVMDFQPKVAIPLSCMTGLGVTMIATGVNMTRRHPLSDRPLIDWDLVLIMEPLTLFGAIAGTYINKVIGQKVLIVLLVLLLSLIAHNTLKKARKMHHAEELYIKRMLWAKQKRRNQNPILATIPSVRSFDGKLAEADPPFIPKVHPSNNVASPTKTEPLLDKDKNDADNTSKDSSSALSSSAYSNSFGQFIVLRKEDAESVKSSLIEEEADPLPQNKITYIFTMFLGVIAFNVFKGGAAFESPLGIICGSFAFWIVEFMTTCWLGCCAVLAARYLLKRHAIKEAVGFDYVRGDIRWDVRTIAIYPIACVGAGLVSGMFGIGCAVLIAPMLVGIGVNPQVAAATCACMNFFTSLAATSSFVVLGSLALYHQYAISLFFLGIVSLFIGKWVMSYSIHSTKIKKNKRLERHSYMAYSMGLVVLVSALSMTVEALLDVLNHSYDDDEIDGICDADQMY